MSETSGTQDAAPRKAGAFDIRNIIGALMGVYGVILTLAGLLGEHEPEKTGGVNANLWTGLALLAVAVAIPLGVVITHSRLLAAVLEPFVAVSQTVPLVAIAPLLVLWIGYGTVPIAVLCAIIAFFPMVTTTVVGLRSLDMRVVENALLDGASAWQRLAHVEGPMAAPAILAGVRGGVVLTMTGAVVGELVMGGAGLGTLLTLTREAADTAGLFAVVAWISLTSLTLHGLVHVAERAAVARLQGETT